MPGLQPGFLVGGVPLNFGVSAGWARAQHFVIEGDEYDTAFFDKRSKFVHYRPRTAVLNNLEFDHADIFDDLAAIERQFHHLVRTVPATGRVVVNGLEESLARVLHMGCWSELRSFGAAVSDFCAQGEPHSFEVLERGQPWRGSTGTSRACTTSSTRWPPSRQPSTWALPRRQPRAPCASFRNVKRRMEVRGTVNGMTVYDDFAHHPTAIRTTVDGLRRKVGAQRILAVFEPRSNTMKLGAMKAQLPWSLEQADLSFCHTGGLDWNAAEVLAPMGEQGPDGRQHRRVGAAGVPVAGAGRPRPVHEQWRLWRRPCQAAAGAALA